MYFKSVSMYLTFLTWDDIHSLAMNGIPLKLSTYQIQNNNKKNSSKEFISNDH